MRFVRLESLESLESVESLELKTPGGNEAAAVITDLPGGAGGRGGI